MIKPILFLSAFFVCLFFTAEAQTDTTDYDLGRISVKKNFTQTITIKGSDLERYQFSDLSDAINVWLYGTYSNSSSLVYVIDGNIINDVNAYSIYDIDEITLVQNALAMVSGANPGQQMVLIKLKTNKSGKQGIEAAGQSSIVNMTHQQNSPGEKTVSDMYNQYYLSGYKNFDNVSFGLSADYQRDIFPSLIIPPPGLTNQSYTNAFKYFNPPHYNRFKLNGYMHAKLWKGSTLNLGLNYVPQVSSYSADFATTYAFSPEATYLQNNNSKVSQHLFNVTAGLNSQIVKGLINTLSIAYNHFNYFENDSDSSTSAGGLPAFTLASSYNKTSNLLIRDNLVYHKQWGGFSVEPAANFSYSNFHDDESNYTESGYDNNPFNSASNNFSSSDYSFQYKLYSLTSSLNIYYKNIFDIQGGFVSNLNPEKDFIQNVPKQRISPFLTTSVNIIQPTTGNGLSLRVFGSFARQNQLLADNYTTLSGFNGNVPTSPYPFAFNSIPFSVGYSNNPYQLFNNYQAGTVLGLSKNFTINYSFEYRYYQTSVEISLPDPPNLVESELVLINDKTITNRIGLNYNFHSNDFTWQIGLNAAETKLQLVDNGNTGNFINGNYINTSYYSAYLNSGHRVTGGFTNRFNYKNLFAGLDVLYQLGERPYSLINALPYEANYITPNHINSVSLQNLYIGSKIKINHLKYAEVFANGRNIIQNKTSDITDNRRFFGLGFKVGL